MIILKCLKISILQLGIIPRDLEFREISRGGGEGLSDLNFETKLK